MSAATNRTNLKDFWVAIQALKPTSPESEFDHAASFVAPDCVLHLLGMNAPPAKGRAGYIEALKSLVTYWALVEHRTLTEAASEDGRTLVTEMDNHLLIMGEPLEHFYETEVVGFDDKGLVKTYHLYVDNSPVMGIIAKKTAPASSE